MACKHICGCVVRYFYNCFSAPYNFAFLWLLQTMNDITVFNWLCAEQMLSVSLAKSDLYNNVLLKAFVHCWFKSENCIIPGYVLYSLFFLCVFFPLSHLKTQAEHEEGELGKWTKDQSFMRIERYNVETNCLEYNHQLGFEGKRIYHSFCNG